MQTRTTDAIPLAPRPDIEQYKRLAKDLAKAASARSGDSIREWANDWIHRLAPLLARSPHPEYTKDRQVERELRAIVDEYTSAPLAADPTLTNAQLFIARIHGFESWPRFSSHIEALTQENSTTSRFEAAADAIANGDLAALERLIAQSPALVHERSTRDHYATLLHYIAANGHEGFRQRTPKNAPALARVVLSAGAKPDALADMYGHRVTTMQMLVSSTHPADAGVQEALVDVLVDFGANPSGVNNEGSPLMTAFRFHYPKAAAALARRGARIDSVVSAAALGRSDLVERMVDDSGKLREPPRASGPWPTLSTDPDQHLGFALAWAAQFGHDDVVELLLRKGVDPHGADDDGAAIHWAAARGRLDLVKKLIAAGASLEDKNAHGGSVLSTLLWHAENWRFHGVDYASVARELIAMGARTDR
jgi:ankyrin repeat protein